MITSNRSPNLHSSFVASAVFRVIVASLSLAGEVSKVRVRRFGRRPLQSLVCTKCSPAGFASSASLVFKEQQMGNIRGACERSQSRNHDGTKHSAYLFASACACCFHFLGRARAQCSLRARSSCGKADQRAGTESSTDLGTGPVTGLCTGPRGPDAAACGRHG